MSTFRIAWGITGAGDYLAETIEVMKRIDQSFDVEITVLLSESGEMVVKWYRLWEELNESFERVKVEKSANVPFVAGPLQVGHYRLLFVSPMTANTTAKVAYGIADSLISNAISQTAKGKTPIYVYPVDQVLGSMETPGPAGETITITTRQVDVDNTELLREMENITVLEHPDDIEAIVRHMVSE